MFNQTQIKMRLRWASLFNRLYWCIYWYGLLLYSAQKKIFWVIFYVFVHSIIHISEQWNWKLFNSIEWIRVYKWFVEWMVQWLTHKKGCKQ